MRKVLLAVFLLLPVPLMAEIASTAQCEAAIASDPQLAREDAGQWARAGGGVAARLCEAAALEAMGATATAARLLSGLAANPGRDLPRELRVVIFEDSARLWIDAGQPDLALASLDRADRLAPATPDRLETRARADAAREDWPGAVSALDALVAAAPRDAGAHALRAAALRHDGRLDAASESAERALEITPDLPEGLFEAGAAAAEAGETQQAEAWWLRLIATHPDHALATLARRNLVRLGAGG